MAKQGEKTKTKSKKKTDVQQDEAPVLASESAIQHHTVHSSDTVAKGQDLFRDQKVL